MKVVKKGLILRVKLHGECVSISVKENMVKHFNIFTLKFHPHSMYRKFFLDFF